MLGIPLNPVPNQTTSFNVDGAYWQLHFYESINYMCADVTCNGVQIISGVRCFGGIALMPYDYMSAPGFGNFYFDSDADWANFGSSCNLFYLEQAEVAEFENLILVGA
jgi:hypothetical protein